MTEHSGEFSVHAEIDRLLNERRPARYETDGGDGWLDTIADEVARLIPISESRQIAARQLVRKREGTNLKSANRLLREIGKTLQVPLGWLELNRLPIVVGKERVRLGRATSDDFERFANEELRRAANDFTARNLTCEAAQWIAGLMRMHDYQYADEIPE